MAERFFPYDLPEPRRENQERLESPLVEVVQYHLLDHISLLLLLLSIELMVVANGEVRQSGEEGHIHRLRLSGGLCHSFAVVRC